MVFSYHLTKYPFRLVYAILSLFGRTKGIYFYCAEQIDLEVFREIQRHLHSVDIVTDKKSMLKYFLDHKIPCKQLPVFPKAVIMCRHACHKFPSQRIIKIGMRHGPYHFKKMTSASNYNLFDIYMFSSQDDLAEAIKTGVKTGVATGYPKLDPALNGEFSQKELSTIKIKAGITADKPILLFSATWPGSGMSGLDLWKHRIGSLKDKYNLMVTLHPWVSDADRELIRKQGIYLVERDVIKHIYISDIVIGDTSSLLAEACALDKPMITWKVPAAKRSQEKIEALIESFSLQVESLDELRIAVKRYLATPNLLSDERHKASRLMFDNLDGSAGKNAANVIIKLLPELKL